MIAVVLAAAAIAAAPAPRDVTYNCTIPDLGGVNPVLVVASDVSTEFDLPEPTGAPVQIFGVFGPQQGSVGGLFSDSRFCKKAKTVRGFSRVGLKTYPPVTGLYGPGNTGGLECWTAAAVTIHVRATFSGRKVTHALVDLRSGKRHRVIVYGELIPGTRALVWASGAVCHDR